MYIHRYNAEKNEDLSSKSEGKGCFKENLRDWRTKKEQQISNNGGFECSSLWIPQLFGEKIKIFWQEVKNKFNRSFGFIDGHSQDMWHLMIGRKEKT